MANKKRWTVKEVQTLQRCVSRNPNNLRKAFEQTAKKLNRTPSACSFKWYADVRCAKALFVTSSSTRVSEPNVKNGRATRAFDHSIWRRILDFFKSF